MIVDPSLKLVYDAGILFPGAPLSPNCFWLMREFHLQKPRCISSGVEMRITIIPIPIPFLLELLQIKRRNIRNPMILHPAFFIIHNFNVNDAFGIRMVMRFSKGCEMI
jgi:hypothetical protein